jgi:2-keto-3-deoxy-L-rhamnonate aldolase RhmA
VPAPGLILISESDLSVSMGYRGRRTPEVDAAVQRAAETCRAAGVPFGSPQVTAANIEQRISDGFQFLMPAPIRDLSVLERGRQLAGR